MVRAPNWVGDAVMAVPALRELRRIFSSARLTLVARDWVAGLFEGEGLADDIVTVEDASGLIQSTRRFFRQSARLGRERFDYAVLLQNAFGAALTARAARVATIAGYPTDGRRFLLDEIIPLQPDYKTAHQVYYYLNIASEVERQLTGESRVEMSAAEPRLRASEQAREKGRNLLARFQIEPEGARIAVINPGATNSRAKQWLAERFAETADLLAERDGFRVVIVGAASDTEAAREVESRMKSPAAVIAGQTTIAELKGVLAASSLVISNDTGPAHVSAALGVPTIIIFGPTEHVATRPLAATATVVRKDVECSPCMLRDCPIDHRCMTGVEVNEVYRAARAAMNHEKVSS